MSPLVVVVVVVVVVRVRVRVGGLEIRGLDLEGSAGLGKG